MEGDVVGSFDGEVDGCLEGDDDGVLDGLKVGTMKNKKENTIMVPVDITLREQITYNQHYRLHREDRTDSIHILHHLLAIWMPLHPTILQNNLLHYSNY